MEPVPALQVAGLAALAAEMTGWAVINTVVVAEEGQLPPGELAVTV